MILNNMDELVYAVGYGIQTAIVTLVGNQIGKADKRSTYLYMRILVIASSSIFICESLVLYYFRVEFVNIMTDNKDVLDAAHPILFLFVMNAFLELVRMGMLRAMIKALNLNEETLYQALFI